MVDDADVFTPTAVRANAVIVTHTEQYTIKLLLTIGHSDGLSVHSGRFQTMRGPNDPEGGRCSFLGCKNRVFGRALRVHDVGRRCAQLLVLFKWDSYLFACV